MARGNTLDSEGTSFLGSDETQSDDTKASFCSDKVYPALARYFGDFRTEKQVVVRSKALRVPEVLLNCCCLLYIILYEFIYKLSFLKLEPTLAQTLVDIRSPRKNVLNCPPGQACEDDILDESRLTNRFPDISSLSYCTDGLPPSITGGCRFFDINDMVRGQYSQSLFLATAVTRVYEERCPSQSLLGQAECPSLWITNKSATMRYYNAAVEQLQVQFEHSFGAENENEMLDGMNAQGWLMWHNGSVLKRIPCSDAVCSYGEKAWEIKYEACGDIGDGDGACFSVKGDDYISLGVLLNASGISLDEFGGEGDHVRTTRERGAAMLLEIEYMTANSQVFWTWPWGPKPMYNIKPRRLVFDNLKPRSLSKIIRDYHDLSQRRVDILNGLLIIVHAHGHVAELHFTNALMVFIVQLALLRFAKLFVNYVLVELYGCLPCCRHVRVLHKLMRMELSPETLAVKEVLEENELGSKEKGTHIHQLRSRNEIDRIEEFSKRGELRPRHSGISWPA